MAEELLAKAYVKGALDLLQGKIDGMPKIVVIPNNATNGDMIKAMFPNLKVKIEGTHITCWNDKHIWFTPNYDWWNAKYKKEVEE